MDRILTKIYLRDTTLIAVLYFFVRLVSTEAYTSQCLNSGFKCSSCEKLVHCVETPDGFKTTFLLKCNNEKNEYCSVESGGCSSDSKVCRIFGMNQFECETIGAFPDPFDCTVYHICREENGIIASSKHNCPDSRAYDPLSATCRFKTTHEICQENPVPECQSVLQHGSVKGNPNIYFVCLPRNGVLEPRLYKCKDDQIYTDSKCLASKNVEEFVCKSVGNFIDPKDCYKYYECDSNLKAVHKTCRPGTYFDDKEKICLRGTC